jgi:hypothetical protein
MEFRVRTVGTFLTDRGKIIAGMSAVAAHHAGATISHYYK